MYTVFRVCSAITTAVTVASPAVSDIRRSNTFDEIKMLLRSHWNCWFFAQSTLIVQTCFKCFRRLLFFAQYVLLGSVSQIWSVFGEICLSNHQTNRKLMDRGWQMYFDLLFFFQCFLLCSSLFFVFINCNSVNLFDLNIIKYLLADNFYIFLHYKIMEPKYLLSTSAP